jgi:hypothetical protein
LRTVTIEDGLILPIVNSASGGKASEEASYSEPPGRRLGTPVLRVVETYSSPARIAAGGNGAAGTA